MIRKKYEPDQKYGFTSIDGASSITGLSKSALYKAIAKKAIKYYKPAGKILFKVSELKEWIEGAACKPGA